MHPPGSTKEHDDRTRNCVSVCASLLRAGAVVQICEQFTSNTLTTGDPKKLAPRPTPNFRQIARHAGRRAHNTFNRGPTTIANAGHLQCCCCAHRVRWIAKAWSWATITTRGSIDDPKPCQNQHSHCFSTCPQDGARESAVKHNPLLLPFAGTGPDQLA